MENMADTRLKTGTTTVAVLCKDGVVLAADQKATMGNFVASKKAKKVFELSDKIAMTIAGSVGDAQALVRLMKAEIKLYELQEKHLTTKAAATLLANILRGAYKSYMPEWVQLVIGGYDEKGAQLYSLDLAGGLSPEDEYTFSGSGSVIAVGVLEDGYKKNMTTEEGTELVLRAIRAAKERDTYTGGKSMDVAVIKKDGISFVPQEKVKQVLKSREEE